MSKIQIIQDINNSCYESGTFNYRKQIELIREQISMQEYLEYCVWKCDLEYDLWKIFYEVQAIFPEITEKQVIDAINNKQVERTKTN